MDSDVELGDNYNVGVKSFWSAVNHVAITVSDVGRSLGFYANIIGMKQVIRPDFDRHGAWLTFGNVDLHLIKGPPAVHHDDDLIVGHIALTVPEERMLEIRNRLKEMGVTSRQNISVPNPSVGRPLTQAFVKDPDGYYIEFCSCASLEEYLKEKMAANEEDWHISTALSATKIGIMLRKKAVTSKKSLEHMLHEEKEIHTPDWLKDDFKERFHMEEFTIDEKKLKNLTKRRKVYGDICQNVTEAQLQNLMMKHSNNIPKVLLDIETWVLQKGTQTLTPPAFYERNGSLYQPPSFEMPLVDCEIIRNENRDIKDIPSRQDADG